MRWLWATLLLGVSLSAAPASSAQVADSLARPAPPVALDTLARTSRGAVTRALLLPGLGQVYNREPLKAPIATGLVVGAVVYFVDRQRQYILYRRAAAYAGCVETPGDPETSPDRVELCAAVLEADQDEYDRLNADTATDLTFATLSGVRQTARSQRDIGGVIVLGAYALQALDAYVSAELADFDVSEDLSLRLLPSPTGPALGLRVGL